MSGSAIGTGIGFVAGFFLPGGPALWSSIGGAIGGYVDPEVIKQQGPRLSDAGTQTARDGIPITIGYATFPTMGNIIWSGPLVENVIVDRQRQGKGGPVVETTTYQYTSSYAIGICEGPITGLLIVKKNRKIVYDARSDEELTAVGYDSAAISASRAASAAFMANAVVYLGDQDQLPDSVMESHLGVGNVSAYRGLAYIRFENDDLSDIGGAIPQFEFVVNGSGNTTVSPAPETGLLFHYPLNDAMPGGVAVELVAGKNGHYSSDHVSSGPALSVGGSASAFFNDFGGYMLCDIDAGDSIPPDMRNRSEWSVSVWCQNTASTNPDPNDQGTVQKIVAMFGNGAWEFGEANWNLLYKGPNSPDSIKHQYPYGSYSTGGSSYAVQGEEVNGLYRTVYMVMTYKDNPAYGLSKGDLRLYKNGALVDIHTNVPRPTANGAAIMVGGGYIISAQGQFFGYVADLKGYSRELSSTEIAETWRNSSTRYYENPDAPGTWIDANGNIVHYEADVINREEVTVGEVVADILQRAGLTSADYDVSALTDPIDGYRIATEGGGDAFINPLLVYSFADCVEYDSKLRFVKRGGAINHTLTMDDLAERDGDAIEQERVQEAELLRRQTVGYLDPLATYTATTQQWERRSGTVEAKGEASIELPVVATGTTIAHVAEKRGKVAWSETDKFKFSLPQKWSKITPTDRASITDAGGAVHRVRVMQVEEDSGTLYIESVRDRQASYTATTAAVVPTFPDPTPPTVRGPTMMVAFNGPPLTSEQNVPGIHVAFRGLSAGHLGTDLYISADGGVSKSFAGRYTNQSVIGWLTGDITSSPSDTINVQFYGGDSLETVTDSELAAGYNAWALVSGGLAEIGQSQTSTLVPDTFNDTYGLTDNSRGLSGSTATSHYEDDPFVLMDQRVNYVPIDYRYKGTTLRLYPVSIGTSLDSTSYTELVYDPPEIVWDGNGDTTTDPTGPTPSGGGTGSSSSGLISISIGATTVNVDSYGAVGNGVTDDSAAFAAAFAALPVGGGTVQCTSGKTYAVDPEAYDCDADDSDRCAIKMLNNTRLDLNGATLQGLNTNNDFRHIVHVYEKHDVEIKGGTIIGWRDNTSWSGPTSTDTKEHGHNIAIYGSDKVIVKNLTSKKATGDSVSIGRRLSSSQSTNCYVWDCILTQSRRQGISIGRSNVVKVKGCTITYISGTAPQAGIDVEPDNPATQQSTNTTITNCTIQHCKGPGVQAYKSANTVTVEGCTLEYNNRGIYAIDADNGIARDNTIRYNLNSGIYLKGSSASWTVGGVGDENTMFSNKTSTYGTHTTGATTTVTGTSSVTNKHLNIDSTASATVGANIYGPV